MNKILQMRAVQLWRIAEMTGLCLLLLFVSLPTRSIVSAQAVVTNGAKVSFTFDDGFASAYNKAAPALAQYGFVGTSYVTSSFIAKRNYMTWDQVKKLQDTYGWEIGGHSVNHPLLTSLTPEQIKNEVVVNKQDLTSRGINARSFATPFGDYDNRVVAEIARNYETHRTFHDLAYNLSPYSEYRVQVQQVQTGVSTSTVKGYIDSALQSGRWLVLVFHDIKDNPSRNKSSYEYATKDLKTVASYVKSKGIPVARVSDVPLKGQNLLTNGGFEQGLNNWSTDTPSSVTVDTLNMGSFPSSANAIKLVSNTSKTAHLFSSNVSIDASKTYILKSFLNVTSITANEIGYYIDEYDANGNWVSGKYTLAEKNVYVQNRNIQYKPSNSNVRSVRLQIVIPQASNIVAYIDNIELFSL